MGEPNNALKAYMSRPDRIKSVLEYYLRERLPEDWECREAGGFVTVRNAKGKLSFRQRDFFGEACAWGTRFWLGVENQESVNLTYPWRLMEMDCLEYGREIEEIQEKNSVNRENYGLEDDYKYHYKKKDRLRPILNLVLYWGKKEWKGPLSLGEMMEDMGSLPKRMRCLAGDYEVHLIPMRFISEAELQKMDSDLKYVLGIMKHTSSSKRYEKYIFDNRDFFSKIPKSAMDVIDVYTNIGNVRNYLKYEPGPEDGEEETDLCKALRDMRKHAIKQGERIGERQGTLKTLFSLVDDGYLVISEAARRAKLSETEFCSEMKRAGYGR